MAARPLVGMMEVAKLLGVSYQHVRRMRSLESPLARLPDSDVPGRPLWYVETIHKWMVETGRIDCETGKVRQIGNHNAS